jgi:hypothetical protein
MSELYDTMTAFFKEDEWPMTPIEGSTAVSTGFSSEVGQWRCYGYTREAYEQVIFYSVCPVNVPPERRDDVAIFLTRANYDLFIGNFEMDYSDGEVRYKTSLDVEGAQLTTALMKQLVYANVMMMERYLPGILKVTYGEMTPETAIAYAEGEETDDAESDWDDLAAETVDVDSE